MTTHINRIICCAVCGFENEHIVIGSTSTFGSSDLDTRPPEMERSILFSYVQRCAECGYCTKDLSTVVPQASSFVRNLEYTCQLADLTYPDLANSFLCDALIQQSLAKYSLAAWSLIHASWVCDDAMKSQQAKMCRSKAADMISVAIHNGQRIANQDGAETALQVDLLRRAGRLNEAQQMIQEKRSIIKEEIILKILAFEEALIATGDEACHTVSEVLLENESQ